mmetsp:Transcript_13146/g.22239  ORF Transcript_13146/g.22239 Transcript_13146/m.22239 type:complete len:223 (+) Transcript_13146:669-1337(+)
MKYYHIIGMIALVLCSVLLSLQDLIYPKDESIMANKGTRLSLSDGLLPTWIPVLFGIITPISFTANQMLAKSFRRGPVKFNIQQISFMGFLVVNIIVLFPTVYYWIFVDFNLRLFVVGIIGSIINTFGKVCIQNAVSLGPAGPASALLAMNSLILLVYDAVKNSKQPTLTEYLGLVLGLFGSLILVVPGMFERMVQCMCFGGNNASPTKRKVKKTKGESKEG